MLRVYHLDDDAPVGFLIALPFFGLIYGRIKGAILKILHCEHLSDCLSGEMKCLAQSLRVPTVSKIKESH
jgi:hypothetical protein